MEKFTYRQCEIAAVSAMKKETRHLIKKEEPSFNHRSNIKEHTRNGYGLKKKTKKISLNL